MNRLNFKRLFSNLCCSNCGKDFDENSVFILREEDGLLVLQIICQHCQKSFGVAILGMDAVSFRDENSQKYPLEVKELPSPITDDDVIDAHRFIKNLDADWQKYIPKEYKDK